MGVDATTDADRTPADNTRTGSGASRDAGKAGGATLRQSWRTLGAIILGAIALVATGRAVAQTDTTAPRVTDAYVLANDNRTIYVELSESLDGSSRASTAVLAVKINGTARFITPNEVVIPDNKLILIVPSKEIRPGETVTVSYLKPATIRFKDTSGNELASFVDRAVTNNLPATEPEAPENLQTTRYGNRRMTLRWDVPWSGGSPILKYQVRHARGKTPTGEWTNVAGGGNGQSYIFPNLASANSYTFQVRAVNTVGAGEEESITKTTLSAPSRVRNLRATASNARVILRWAPPLNLGGEGAFLLRYEYQQKAGSGSWSEWKYAGEAWQRGRVVTGLSNGTNYSVRMRAANQDLAGRENTSVSSTPAPQFRLSVHPSHFVVGGESTTATFSITDGYVLETDTTFYLRWFGKRVSEGGVPGLPEPGDAHAVGRPDLGIGRTEGQTRRRQRITGELLPAIHQGPDREARRNRNRQKASHRLRQRETARREPQRTE